MDKLQEKEEQSQNTKQVKTQYEAIIDKMRDSIEQAQKQNHQLQSTIIENKLDMQQLEAQVQHKQTKLNEIEKSKQQEMDKIEKYSEKIKLNFED